MPGTETGTRWTGTETGDGNRDAGTETGTRLVFHFHADNSARGTETGTRLVFHFHADNSARDRRIRRSWQQYRSIPGPYRHRKSSCVPVSAPKVPQPELLMTPESRKRFQREAHAAAALDHPNIVPVYESGGVDTIAYITAAYIAGPTLSLWLSRQKRPVPAHDAAKLVATLARAIEHAHERGILHRDLKPSNILLQCPGLEADPDHGENDSLADFEPRITDSSLAKLADGLGPDTMSGVPFGSPPYMAPEQAEGKLTKIGPPADVYGLGCILYELLTREPPFCGETQLDTLRQVIADDPLPPRRRCPDLPVEIEAIVLKCLEKDPGRRYPSARELADDLDRFLAGAPI
jgi:eukaryotic-like serine/threonine-protein kinase